MKSLTFLRNNKSKYKKLSIPFSNINLKPKCFELSSKNETSKSLIAQHQDNDEYSGSISYISDIHLLHRFNENKCKTFKSKNYLIRSIAETVCNESTAITLIGGDTSSDFDVFKSFIKYLNKYNRYCDFFITLGNHELWGLHNVNFETIVKKYNEEINNIDNMYMHLVQNNLFYLENSWIEITEDELCKISTTDLRNRTRKAKLIIFGGVGFAGMNDNFNANNGIYMNVLNRADEIKESSKFLSLYSKVTKALFGKNLIVFTHMPFKDWAGDNSFHKDGIVYVNGHNHRNYFFDDGNTRIYSDNQIGYHGKNLSLKQFSINFTYDWFIDYNDGIFEISKIDYINFYRGIGEPIVFNRKFKNLFMIKRDKTYMFILKAENNNLYILNGGQIKKTNNHNLEYFYKNIVNYSKSIKEYLSKYYKFQKNISNEVRLFGGSGKTHGCIVDIDFFNHLYVNPFDNSITPYFAYSIIDKYVYKNIASLLKYKCPFLYKNYKELIKYESNENSISLYNENFLLSREYIYVNSTEIYKISRIIKGLQYITKYNIVRIWNDYLADKVAEANGKLLVQNIINSNSISTKTNNQREGIIIKNKKNHSVFKPTFSLEEKRTIRENKYKESVNNVTNGLINCTIYRGSKEKANYKCNNCGYEWSTRPDFFKDKQKYQCPNCKRVDKTNNSLTNKQI